MDNNSFSGDRLQQYQQWMEWKENHSRILFHSAKAVIQNRPDIFTSMYLVAPFNPYTMI